jgi:hypothetical protein
VSKEKTGRTKTKGKTYWGSIMGTQQEGLLHNRKIKLENLAEGEKFLIMSREDKSETMEKVSPWILKMAINSTAGSEVNMVKKLRNGTVLIHTKNRKQAEKLVTIIQLDSSTRVKITEHEKLNQKKGVIKCLDLMYLEDNYILQELASQNVIDIKRIKKRNNINGKEEETGTYFLTFGTVNIPEHIFIGYERVKVREFIPDPLRCFKCLKFDHTQNQCKENKICGNCGEEEHTDPEKKERCHKKPKCTNCGETDHGSLSRKCKVFENRKELMTIKTQNKISLFEARRIQNLRNPFQGKTFSDTVSQGKAKTCNCACTCDKNPPELKAPKPRAPDQEDKRNNNMILTESDMEEMDKENAKKSKNKNKGKRDIETTSNKSGSTTMRSPKKKRHHKDDKDEDQQIDRDQ